MLDTSMEWLNVIEIHCPTEFAAAFAIQAVPLFRSLWSKAPAGPSDGSSKKGAEPNDEADTVAPPIGAATV